MIGETRQIRCVCKNERYNPNDRITHIGGVHLGGKRWKLTQQEAIRGIEDGRFRFYVNAAGERNWLVVAFSVFGNLYLKTEFDKDEPNSLLNLPECPREAVAPTLSPQSATRSL